MLTKRSLFWHFLNFFEVRTKPELRRTYDKYISQQQSKIWRTLKYKSKKKSWLLSTLRQKEWHCILFIH
jgi:hypothetical protein